VTVDTYRCLLEDIRAEPQGKGIGTAVWPLVEKVFKKDCDEIWLIPSDAEGTWDGEGPQPSTFFEKKGFNFQPWREDFSDITMFKSLLEAPDG